MTNVKHLSNLKLGDHMESSLLNEFLDQKIAEDFGLKPEQITPEFMYRMRKRMYKDPYFQTDRSTLYSRDTNVREHTFEQEYGWKKACEYWAQEVLKEIEDKKGSSES